MKSFFKEYGFAILTSVVVVALVAVCMVLKEPIQARLGEITNTWGNNVVNSLKFTNSAELNESTSTEEESNPYAAKVASVQKLYDVGEANLTADDIIQINGIDCYVLQVDGNKAELITKGIYDTRFNSTNTGAQSEYNYATSNLKTWMDNFYTNQLGSDSRILESNVTSYYKNTYSTDLTTFSTQSLNQYVFALDAIEAQSNKSKFSWKYKDGCIDNPSASVYGFWVSAGCNGGGYSDAFSAGCYGNFSYGIVGNSQSGARPAFWISLD